MRVVVVGAGMSGLVAARALADASHDVVVIDKGRGPGGRLATRRVGAATIDHGAQFFTIRSQEFQHRAEPLVEQRILSVWCHGFGTPDGHPRYRVEGGMNRLAKHLAVGLDVRCSKLAFAVVPHRHGWQVVLDDATTLEADAVILTAPVPQSRSLLVTSGVELPEALQTIDYDRTLSLLAVLDRSPGLAPPGAAQRPDPTFDFVSDNQAKGISAVPALTLHVGAELSERWWDDDPAAVHQRLLGAATAWFGGATVVDSQVKRWRFATPRTIWPEPCWVSADGPPLALAGDAFAGPRVEGAFLSGLAAARAILDR